MSILKQVLSDALGSLARRPSDEPAAAPAVPAPAATGARPTISLEQTAAARPGLKTVILNWNRGENDPFTVLNATIRRHFMACGKNVEIVEVSAPDWVARIAEHAANGVDFAFTWQGIASDTRVRAGEREVSLWEFLKVPLVCVHGDHPSHRPANHQFESPYCFHLYTNADFARYSNRHFRRLRSASVIDIPMLHHEQRLAAREGDWFVFAKNVDDPAATEGLWRERLDKPVYEAHMAAVEILKARLAQERHVELHDVLDEFIEERNLAALHPARDIDAYHFFHSRVDHYLRSYRSIAVVAALRDFPVRVYGRGWERIARDAPRSHVFEAGRQMADSQALYYSRYGIVDVSPSKNLHDRTRRAMANGTAFLSSANLEDSIADCARYDSLFYSFRADELAAKCAAVVRDPDAHLEASRRFADFYHDRFHFRDFVARIEGLAQLARAS